MRNLNNFIDDINNWGSFFNRAQITFPLTQSDADSIAQDLDCKLSPENLHCDGEISTAEADRKYRYYGRVIQDLEQYCRMNALTMPKIWEYY
jgi:hypothetical protein